MVTKVVEVHQASLNELLALIQSGTEVILMDGEQPLARVLPIEAHRVAGLSRGSIRARNDFDEPLGDTFWLAES
jgi:antitoxin (DNA-binding transcriptional repressor) of toxin-antitoxin stability system